MAPLAMNEQVVGICFNDDAIRRGIIHGIDETT